MTMYDDNNIFAGDADIEMADLQDIADREDRLRAKGICCHGSLHTFDDGTCECCDCGEKFNGTGDAWDARDNLLQ